MSKPKAYMPLYIGDYMADTAQLSAEEHGAYFLLLITMWRQGGSLPSDGRRLCRIASVYPDRWPTVWATIGAFFDEKDGQITQQRLSKELDECSARKAAATRSARYAARKRWAKQRSDDGDSDGPGSDADTAPDSALEDAPGNAARMPDALRDALPDALRDAMPEQCPSTSTSTSTSSSPSSSSSTSPAPESIRSDSIRPDAAAVEVMQYWNGLTDRCWNVESKDGEFLRERLLEGHTFDVCCLVVEAAVASGIQHPRQAFSRECFAGLLDARRDPRRWSELRPRLEAAIERWSERTA